MERKTQNPHFYSADPACFCASLSGCVPPVKSTTVDCRWPVSVLTPPSNSGHSVYLIKILAGRFGEAFGAFFTLSFQPPCWGAWGRWGSRKGRRPGPTFPFHA